MRTLYNHLHLSVYLSEIKNVQIRAYRHVYGCAYRYLFFSSNKTSRIQRVYNFHKQTLMPLMYDLSAFNLNVWAQYSNECTHIE